MNKLYTIFFMASVFICVESGEIAETTYTPTFFDVSGNFWFAEQYCHSVGMQMVTPDTPEKLATIIALMVENSIDNVYTSGSDLAVEGTFVWMTTFQPVVEPLDWHVTQPDNNGDVEHCIEILYRDDVYKLNDRRCTEDFTVFCEPIPRRHDKCD